jgi:hypothetical protein
VQTQTEIVKLLSLVSKIAFLSSGELGQGGGGGNVSLLFQSFHKNTGKVPFNASLHSMDFIIKNLSPISIFCF